MKSTRGMLFLLLAGLFSSAALAMTGGDATEKAWRFNVFLDDRPIGYHHFSLKQDGESEQISSVAKFDVTFFAIPVFKYRHENTEKWRGSCLKQITSTTRQNGKDFRLQGEQKGSWFELVTQDSEQELPACVSTFAYWNKSFLSRKRLLNSQTGEYIDVDIRYLGEQALPVERAASTAHQYQIVAEDTHILLWYSEDGEWLALQSTTPSGQVLRYLEE